MSYPALRPLLFALDPETAHDWTLAALDGAHRTGLTRWLGRPPPPSPRTLLGLRFANPVGLAAGLDKNGDHIDALGDLGFGFIEVGTVTPRPQPGNPRPRLFRLPARQAIINRMGFNNKGVDHLVEQVRRARYDGIIGINIGKNFTTPVERAVDDYLSALRKVYPVADYVTVNISSPNTPGLRDLQRADALDALLRPLKEQQQRLADRSGRHVPLLVKIAPDLSVAELDAIASTLLRLGVDGVIATNTTNRRDGVTGLAHADEQGGLSGAPLTDRAETVTRQLADRLAGELPIIAAGGIMCADDARRRLEAGASLVQVYSGLIYRGPGLIGEIVDALARATPAGTPSTAEGPA